MDDSAATKTCPQCAEQVQAAAQVCRYCSYSFVDAPSPGAAGTSPPPTPVHSMAAVKPGPPPATGPRPARSGAITPLLRVAAVAVTLGVVAWLFVGGPGARLFNLCGSGTPFAPGTCSKLNRSDKDTLVDSVTAYSKADIALAKQTMVCDTAATIAASRRQLNPNGYRKCNAESLPALTRTYKAAQAEYRTAHAYLRGSCGSRLDTWHSQIGQAYTLMRRVATSTVRPVGGYSWNREEIRGIYDKASAAEKAQLQTMKTIAGDC